MTFDPNTILHTFHTRVNDPSYTGGVLTSWENREWKMPLNALNFGIEGKKNMFSKSKTFEDQLQALQRPLGTNPALGPVSPTTPKEFIISWTKSPAFALGNTLNQAGAAGARVVKTQPYSRGIFSTSFLIESLAMQLTDMNQGFDLEQSLMTLLQQMTIDASSFLLQEIEKDFITYLKGLVSTGGGAGTYFAQDGVTNYKAVSLAEQNDNFFANIWGDSVEANKFLLGSGSPFVLGSKSVSHIYAKEYLGYGESNNRNADETLIFKKENCRFPTVDTYPLVDPTAKGELLVIQNGFVAASAYNFYGYENIPLKIKTADHDSAVFSLRDTFLPNDPTSETFKSMSPFIPDLNMTMIINKSVINRIATLGANFNDWARYSSEAAVTICCEPVYMHARIETPYNDSGVIGYRLKTV